MLLPIHIVAGALAMILGAVALLAPKGPGCIAAVLGNIGGGLMSAYFVVTAPTTVRPSPRGHVG